MPTPLPRCAIEYNNTFLISLLKGSGRASMIDSHDKGTLLHIQTRTNSKRAYIQISKDVCQVFVKAPPRRGQANQEVIRLFAKTLRISSQRIHLMAGEKTKHKILLIEGMEPELVLASLQG